MNNCSKEVLKINKLNAIYPNSTTYVLNGFNLKMNRGDRLALVGSSGISSGPHLHFEIWREFKPVDPLLYFPEYSYTDLTF